MGWHLRKSRMQESSVMQREEINDFQASAHCPAYIRFYKTLNFYKIIFLETKFLPNLKFYTI